MATCDAVEKWRQEALLKLRAEAPELCVDVLAGRISLYDAERQLKTRDYQPIVHRVRLSLGKHVTVTSVTGRKRVSS